MVPTRAEQEPVKDDSAEDFIINKTKPSKPKKRKAGVRRRTVPKKQRLLQQAAQATGQRTVRDFFLTGDEESQVEGQFFCNCNESGDGNIRVQSPIVIDSSSDCPMFIMDTSGFDQSGPINVSSPHSDTQVFDSHPSQSPIY